MIHRLSKMVGKSSLTRSFEVLDDALAGDLKGKPSGNHESKVVSVG